MTDSNKEDSWYGLSTSLNPSSAYLRVGTFLKN